MATIKDIPESVHADIKKYAKDQRIWVPRALEELINIAKVEIEKCKDRKSASLRQ